MRDKTWTARPMSSPGLTIRLLAMVLVLGPLTPADSSAQEQKASAKPVQRNWSSFYDRTAGRPPRAILLEALEAFEQEGREVRRAVDAGCGAGVETLFLSRLGAQVSAFDSAPEGIARLSGSLDEQQAKLVRLQVAPFHEADWGEEADLIFAGFALPFARPTEFPEAWRRLTAALARGGRFAGHLFGDRDGWAGSEHMTHLDRTEVEALLDGAFEIEVLREIEHDRKTASGAMKHWHIFEIIARKR